MKFQSQKSSCGPAALSAALEAIGIERTESELAHLCGTGPDGTDWEGILKALAVVRKSEPDIVGKAFQEKADVALLRLLRALHDGHPLVVCVCTEDPWDHFAAVVGSLGSGHEVRIGCFDPGSNEAYRSMTITQFMAWWRGPKGERRPYAGIIV